MKAVKVLAISILTLPVVGLLLLSVFSWMWSDSMKKSSDRARMGDLIDARRADAARGLRINADTIPMDTLEARIQTAAEAPDADSAWVAFNAMRCEQQRIGDRYGEVARHRAEQVFIAQLREGAPLFDQLDRQLQAPGVLPGACSEINTRRRRRVRTGVDRSDGQVRPPSVEDSARRQR